MAELADALDSGSNGRKAVQVQVLLPAPDTGFFAESKRLCVFLFDTKTGLEPFKILLPAPIAKHR